MPLQQLDFEYKKFLDRTTVIYGDSDCGKTYLIYDILHCLQTQIDQIIVFCPSDSQNHEYSGGYVKRPLIHTSINIEKLDKIWRRQEMLASVYSRANNEDILKSIFRKLNDREANNLIYAITKCRSKRITDIKQQYSDKIIQDDKILELDEQFNDIIIYIYKKYINQYHHRIIQLNLTESEKFSIKYLNLNPRIIIIFDDCTEDFKRLQKKGATTNNDNNTFDKMFTKGRKVFITALIISHDEIAIGSAARRGAFISIFATQSTATTYFERKTNGFSNDIKKKVRQEIPNIKWTKPEYEKLVYVRKMNKLFRYRAKKHDVFQFGSDIINKYCEKIENPENQITLRNNEFCKYFNNYGNN